MGESLRFCPGPGSPPADPEVRIRVPITPGRDAHGKPGREGRKPDREGLEARQGVTWGKVPQRAALECSFQHSGI